MIKQRLFPPALAALLLLFAAFPFAARAEERALSVDVAAVMQPDGAMVVTERIRVNIEHKIIRRGITHAYPIKEIYDGHKMRHYSFELLSVRLDGRPVPHHTTGSSGLHHGMAIGSADKLAPRGEHTYEIVYKTTGHVRFMHDRDEIYYNVLSDWEFPAERVSFTLQLPAGGEEAFLDAVAYTGARGESGRDYVLDGKHTVRTTRTLNPGEGLTVAIAWEKGLVAHEESLANIISGNRTAVLIGIFVIMPLFFGVSRLWFLRGSKGVIIPLFSPPEGLSPGYVAALYSMAYEGRMLHADILWLAVNGFLRLDARDEKKMLLRKAALEEPKRLKSGGEWAREQCRQLMDRLFPEPQEELDLQSGPGQALAAASFDYLKEKYSEQQKGLWQRRYTPAVVGAILFVALYGLLNQYIYIPGMYLKDDPFYALLTFCVLLGFFGLAVSGARWAIKKFTGVLRIAALILAVPVCLCVLGMLWYALMEIDIFWISFISAFGVTVRGAAWWCFAKKAARPTRKGKAPCAQVQGLEMYIRTAETHRLAMLNAPEDTVEKFEELLPYAVALDCAEAWRERFEKVLANYTPGWAEIGGGRHAYSNVLSSVAVSSSAAKSASEAAREAASKAAREARRASSSGGSGGGSGFSGGSSGGGSGGSRVGGW